MKIDSRLLVFLPVILLAVVLQVIFVFADDKEIPSRAAHEFVENYFRIDPDMSKRLCEEDLEQDDVNVVDAYIHQKTLEAHKRGFELKFLKQKVFGLSVKTLDMDADTARVEISGSLRTAINPVFAWVARVFFIGESQPIEETLNLVKEDGEWKVCGDVFDLRG